MSSNTIKCNLCNIVIDELLAYKQNKISVSDEDTIVRICASTFNSEQIEKSNKLLLESQPSDLPKIRYKERRGEGKEKRILSDIIGRFKTIDSDLIPIFVARDLDKLPPLNVDHIDVSKLLKDMAAVKMEISAIKCSYVTRDDLEDFRSRGQESRFTSPAFAHKIKQKNIETMDISAHICDIGSDNILLSGEMSSPQKEIHIDTTDTNKNIMEGRSEPLRILTASNNQNDVQGARVGGKTGGATTTSIPLTYNRPLTATCNQLTDSNLHRSYANVALTRIFGLPPLFKNQTQK